MKPIWVRWHCHNIMHLVRCMNDALPVTKINAKLPESIVWPIPCGILQHSKVVRQQVLRRVKGQLPYKTGVQSWLCASKDTTKAPLQPAKFTLVCVISRVGILCIGT